MRSLILPLSVLMVLLVGCGRKEETRQSAGNPAAVHERCFSPVFDSDSALINAALDALAAGDTAGLHRLRVTEAEFEEILWPEFPMSKPEMNVPTGFAWGNLELKSSKGARAAFAAVNGRRLSYSSHEFIEAEEMYTNFTVRQGTQVRVRDSEGREFSVGFFGSIVETNGTFKFMSFRD